MNIRLLAVTFSLALASAASAATVPVTISPAAPSWVEEAHTTGAMPGLLTAVRPPVPSGPISEVQWTYAVKFSSEEKQYIQDGSARFVSAGLRLRPMASLQADPARMDGVFVDLHVTTVRTGGLNRVGVDGGLGYNFQLSPAVGFGPVVRYGQLVMPQGIFARDAARFTTVGVNLALQRPPKA